MVALSLGGAPRGKTNIFLPEIKMLSGVQVTTTLSRPRTSPSTNRAHWPRPPWAGRSVTQPSPLLSPRLLPRAPPQTPRRRSAHLLPHPAVRGSGVGRNCVDAILAGPTRLWAWRPFCFGHQAGGGDGGGGGCGGTDAGQERAGRASRRTGRPDSRPATTS